MLNWVLNAPVSYYIFLAVRSANIHHEWWGDGRSISRNYHYWKLCSSHDNPYLLHQYYIALCFYNSGDSTHHLKLIILNEEVVNVNINQDFHFASSRMNLKVF